VTHSPLKSADFDQYLLINVKIRVYTQVLYIENSNYCEAPQNVHSPFNIYRTDEASDFKFGTQLAVAKANHKIKSKKRVFYNIV